MLRSLSFPSRLGGQFKAFWFDLKKARGREGLLSGYSSSTFQSCNLLAQWIVF